jgi:hypothetical protein
LHRLLELINPLFALRQHVEDAIELLVGLHGDLETGLMIVRCQNRVSDTRCYRTSMAGIDSTATG